MIYNEGAYYEVSVGIFAYGEKGGAEVADAHGKIIELFRKDGATINRELSKMHWQSADKINHSIGRQYSAWVFAEYEGVVE